MGVDLQTHRVVLDYSTQGLTLYPCTDNGGKIDLRTLG